MNINLVLFKKGPCPRKFSARAGISQQQRVVGYFQGTLGGILSQKESTASGRSFAIGGSYPWKTAHKLHRRGKKSALNTYDSHIALGYFGIVAVK